MPFCAADACKAAFFSHRHTILMLFSLPAFKVLLDVLHAFLTEDRTLYAPSLLIKIVVEQPESIFAQKQYCHEIAESHQGHSYVGKAPHKIKTCQRAEHDHADNQKTIDKHGPLARREETYVGLAVIIVAENAAVGEEQSGYGNIDSANAANLVGERSLSELYAVETAVYAVFAEQNDESRARTDEQCVGEHAQRLYEALLGGMGYVGCGGSIRSRAHARLVAEQSALYALHKCRAHSAAQSLMPAKGIANNERYDIGYAANVGQHDKQCQQDVANGHYGHYDAAERRDAMDASEDDKQRKHRYYGARQHGVNGKRALQSSAHGVALHRIESKAERYGDKHCKEDAHPAFFKSLLHIVSRSADIRVFALYLEQLRQ